MIGLKTEEDERFKRFFEKVQEKARENGYIFYLYCGEGHEEHIGDMDAEDLSGWLIPIEKRNEFEPIWNKDRSGDEICVWDKYYRGEVWHISPEGELIIEFEDWRAGYGES